MDATITNAIMPGLDPNELMRHVNIVIEGMKLILQGLGMVASSGLMLIGAAKVITRVVGTVKKEEAVAIMKLIGKLALDYKKIDHDAEREKAKQTTTDQSTPQ